jgi:hypothetical protein
MRRLGEKHIIVNIFFCMNYTSIQRFWPKKFGCQLTTLVSIWLCHCRWGLYRRSSRGHPWCSDVVLGRPWSSTLGHDHGVRIHAPHPHLIVHAPYVDQQDRQFSLLFFTATLALIRSSLIYCLSMTDTHNVVRVRASSLVPPIRRLTHGLTGTPVPLHPIGALGTTSYRGTSS